ncbi:uncharacterized protein LOC119597979 [Penaeus monodon]|uniref:uncharacterized protein LOC119597979 n=1 Tax=Penaeus monodon TaxID=6687 RepID=UPI0018A6F0E2|nr:uncharacterized protein LOC119597979 [Penaeus monodon]
MGTWMVVSLILSSAYQGILTSLLAVPRVEVPVDSLQDLLDYGRMPWSVEYGTALHQLFGDAKSGFYKKIHDGSFLVTSSFEERERMKKERFAILCDFFSMKLIMSDDYGKTGECSYYIAKEVIWSASMAFVFQKDSDVTKHFNKWIVMMRESGLVDRYLQEATTNVTACMVPPGEEAGKGSSLVLSFLDLGGVFLFMFGDPHTSKHEEKDAPEVQKREDEGAPFARLLARGNHAGGHVGSGFLQVAVHQP